MRSGIPSLACILLVAQLSAATAQTPSGKPELCVGAYFTEAQGAEFLRSHAPGSLEGWKVRSAEVHARLLDGARLDGPAELSTRKPVIHSKREMDGYTVENIFFESVPGFYVTANLYRPLGRQGPFAGILSPHGHDAGREGRFREQAQVRCAMLARMGAVVLAWDMVGYGESQQCAHQIPSALRLQMLNGRRALEVLRSLPGVDTARIGITGESGGGTQSFLLAALEHGIRVSVPVVMVSAHFFGGCVCESGMPIHRKEGYQTCNAEIAGLTAPRPMLIVSVGDDWTRNSPKVEYPYLKGIYALHNASDKVENVHLPSEKHDYGPGKRAAMYPFMARHLGLDLAAAMNPAGSIDESPAKVLDRKYLSAIDRRHRLPRNAVFGNEAVEQLLD